MTQATVARDSALEPYRALRFAIEAAREESEPDLLMFTSPTPGEGTTMVAVNYALNALRAEEHVLLIDTQLERPRLHELFGVPRSPGLVDVLQYDLPVSDLSHQIEDGAGQLAVLTAGSPHPHAADLLASPALAHLLKLEQIGRSLVVLDGPPVLTGTCALAIARVDGVVTVVIVSYDGKRRALRRTLRSLELVGGDVLGLVVNEKGDAAAL